MRPRRILVATATLAFAGSMVALAPIAAAAPAGPDVVHGREPVSGEVDGLVYVRAGGYSCGGTLVDPTHVITAAHCAVNRSGNALSPDQVSVGWADSGNYRDLRMHFVDSVEVHPDYDDRILDNDIAVLELSGPIAGATPVRVATVAESQAALQAGDPVTSAGYGALSSTGPSSSTIQVADLTVIPDSTCGDETKSYRIDGITFWGMGVNTNHSVCAIGVKASTGQIIDTCQGDSGGPLYSTGSRSVLVGVVSSGVGCAGVDENGQTLADKTPGVYTRAVFYRSWLQSVGVDLTGGSPVVAPAAPTIVSAVQTRTAGELTVTVAPGDALTVTGYWINAENVTDSGDMRDCITSTTSCTIDGLTEGATYAITAVAFGEQSNSAESAATTVTISAPAAAPVKPTIAKGWDLGRGKVKLKVTVGDQPAGTSVFVTCASSTFDATANVRRGYAYLQLTKGSRYTCRAYAENAVGLAVSKKFTFTL